MTNAQTTPPPGMESEVDQKTLQFQTRQHVLEALSYHIATSTSPQHRSPKRKPVQIAFKNKEYNIIQETDENCDFPLYHFRRPHQEESWHIKIKLVHKECVALTMYDQDAA